MIRAASEEMWAIAETVAAQTDVEARDVIGYSRKACVVRVRWRAWRVARRLGYTRAQIARMAGVDWSTVSHALNSGAHK